MDNFLSIKSLDKTPFLVSWFAPHRLLVDAHCFMGKDLNGTEMMESLAEGHVVGVELLWPNPSPAL